MKGVKSITVERTIRRADGTIEPWVTKAYWHRNPLRRLLYRLRGVTGTVTIGPTAFKRSILDDVRELAALLLPSWNQRQAALVASGVPLAVFGEATVINFTGKAKYNDQVILESSGKPPKFGAIGVGAEEGGGHTAEAADTTLVNEKESRTTFAPSAITTTHTHDTYQGEYEVTATAARVVNEAGIFDESTVGKIFCEATFKQDNLALGDSIKLRFKIQLT